MICECKFLGNEMLDIYSDASIKASRFCSSFDLCKYGSF